MTLRRTCATACLEGPDVPLIRIIARKTLVLALPVFDPKQTIEPGTPLPPPCWPKYNCFLSIQESAR